MIDKLIQQALDLSVKYPRERIALVCRSYEVDHAKASCAPLGDFFINVIVFGEQVPGGRFDHVVIDDCLSDEEAEWKRTILDSRMVSRPLAMG
jgi:hypothetical protein